MKNILTRKEIKDVVVLYNLGEVAEVKYLKGGLCNENFLIKTSKGKYVFRVPATDNWEWVERSTKILFKFLTYLKAKKYPYQIPRPIKNKKGKYLHKMKKKYVWVYPYIEGKIKEKVSAKQFKEMAKAAALLYKYSKDFKYKKKRQKQPYEWVFREYDKMSKIKSKNRIDELVVENVEFFRGLLKKIEKYNLDKNISLIHGDIHQGNVLFDEDKLIGMLDFDNLGWHSRAKELALATKRTAFLEKGFNKKKMKIFLNEYEKYEKIPKKDKKLIIPALIEDYCITFWWIYFELKKQRHKRKEWLKEIVENAKRDEHLLK